MRVRVSMKARNICAALVLTLLASVSDFDTGWKSNDVKVYLALFSGFSAHACH